MFSLNFLVKKDDASPVVTVELEPLMHDVFQGRCSAFASVYEISLAPKSWMPVYQHQYLRPVVLTRATAPNILTQINWIAPNGQPFSTWAREGLHVAFRDGMLIANTPVTIHSTEGRFGATAQELLPREQTEGWGVGKALLAITAGAAAVGLGVYGYQRYQYNNELVDMRDPVLRAELYARDEGTCRLCGTRVKLSGFQLDHRCPRSRGGPDTRANLQTSHALCNQRKGDKTEEEYSEYLRRCR